MDHKYIEEQRVADRYLDRTLPVPERSAFEKHFVDCPECLDRLALAEIFRDTPPRYRNIAAPSGPAGPPAPVPETEPVVRPTPKSSQRHTFELIAIFLTAGLLFVSVPAAYFIWQSATEKAGAQGPSAALYSLSRGTEKTIRLASAPHPVVFSVDLVDDPAAVQQRVSLVAKDKIIWKGGTLVDVGGAAPGIAVPSTALPNGASSLRIEAKHASGEWRVIAEFALRTIRNN